MSDAASAEIRYGQSTRFFDDANHFERRLERLREHKPGLLAALRRRSSDEIVPEPERLNEPFPLTDVQQAYWIGRDASYELGGVAAHSYVESEVAGLDIQRLEDALNALIARHDMLRMIVMPTGEQCILPDVPRYRVRVHDVSTLPAPERVTWDPNCCAGKNECKGQGRCAVSGINDCAGKNQCKGHGGCHTNCPPPGKERACCRGLNECKGKGGCKTANNECKGMNECKGKGGCRMFCPN